MVDNMEWWETVYGDGRNKPDTRKEWMCRAYAYLGDCIQDGIPPTEWFGSPYPTMEGANNPLRFQIRGRRIIIQRMRLNNEDDIREFDIKEYLPATVSYAFENAWAVTIGSMTPWQTKVNAFLTEYPWLVCGTEFQRVDFLTPQGALEIIARHPEVFTNVCARQFETLVEEILGREGWNTKSVERLNASGVDICAFRMQHHDGNDKEEFMIVECKAWKGPVDVSVIRSIACARDYEYKADQAMVACKESLYKQR